MKQVLGFLGGIALGAGTFYAVRKIRNATSLGASDMLKNAVDVHTRQIQRYAYAASQDTSPIVGITHASYALILLDTLEELLGKDRLQSSGFNATKIRKFVTDQQDRHAKRLQGCDNHLQTILAMAEREGIKIDVGGAPRGA